MKRLRSLLLVVGVLFTVLVACGDEANRAGLGASASGEPVGSNPSGSDGGSGTDAGPSAYARPYTLRPLSPPRTSTANISLFFSVVDNNGVGVSDLVEKPPRRNAEAKDVFDAFEDGAQIDPNESFFDVIPLSGQRVAIPTVLLLDLSGSVVKGGALSALKNTATAIIDGLLPEQTLAVLSFADGVKQRSPFSKDKVALKMAVGDITQADGLSTNLYGAMVQGLGMWQDGYLGGSGSGQLTAGLAIVVTDGSDTAALSTLDAVIKTRGDKRVVSIGIGTEFDATKKTPAFKAMTAMSSTGAFIYREDFAALEADVLKLTANLQSLNRGIYQANYCSPKRSGNHNLVFTVKNNGVVAGASCKAAIFSQGCSIAGSPEHTENCGQLGNTSICCPTTAPYHCPETSDCYPTAEAAAKDCATSCTRCGGTGQANQTTVEGGTAIRVGFVANGYQSQQCPPFYPADCKTAAACCDGLPSLVSNQCSTSIEGSGGNEAQCTSLRSQYCKVLGSECTKALQCCKTFGAQVGASCWNAAQGQESSCTSYVSAYCESVGPSCMALRNCCATMTEPGRSTCEQQYIAAAGNETQCQASKPASCP